MQVDLDKDLEGISRTDLMAELKRVRQRLRKHERPKGHSRCHECDRELWCETLPEYAHESPPDQKIPPFFCFMFRCLLYRIGYWPLFKFLHKLD